MVLLRFYKPVSKTPCFSMGDPLAGYIFVVNIERQDGSFVPFPPLFYSILRTGCRFSSSRTYTLMSLLRTKCHFFGSRPYSPSSLLRTGCRFSSSRTYTLMNLLRTKCHFFGPRPYSPSSILRTGCRFSSSRPYTLMSACAIMGKVVYFAWFMIVMKRRVDKCCAMW